LVKVIDIDGIDLYLAENPFFVKDRTGLVLKFAAGEKSMGLIFKKAREYYRSPAAVELFGGQTEAFLNALDVMEAKAQADEHMRPFVVVIVFPESSDGEQLVGVERGRSSQPLYTLVLFCFLPRRYFLVLTHLHPLNETVFQLGAETDADVSAQPLIGQSSVDTLVGGIKFTSAGLLFHVAVAETSAACSVPEEGVVDVATAALSKKMSYMGLGGMGEDGHDSSTSDSDQESQGMPSFILNSSHPPPTYLCLIPHLPPWTTDNYFSSCLPFNKSHLRRHR